MRLYSAGPLYAADALFPVPTRIAQTMHPFTACTTGREASLLAIESAKFIGHDGANPVFSSCGCHSCSHLPILPEGLPHDYIWHWTRRRATRKLSVQVQESYTWTIGGMRRYVVG